MSNRSTYLARATRSLTQRLHYRYSGLMSHAKDKGTTFTLTFDEFKAMWVNQKGRSAYTGKRMLLSTFGKGLITRNTWGMTVDRLDPNEGYIATNCVMVRFDENNRKQRTSFFTPEFLETFPDWTAQVLSLRPDLNQIAA